MRLTAPPNWFVPALVAAFALFVLIVAIALIIGPAGASYNVTAQTERIELSIEEKPKWRWVFEDVEFIENGDSFDAWSGEIELASSVDVVIQRVGLGQLWVLVQCKSDSIDEPCKSAGIVFENAGMTQRPLGSDFEILVRDIPARAISGATVSLAITGRVILGRPVGMDTAAGIGVLREGRVTMLVRNIFGDGVFDGGSAVLDIGDRFEVTDVDEESETLGFVVVDERPAMTAAYRVNGRNAAVYRPGGGSYAVSTTAFARLIGDPVFRVLAGLLAILAAAAQIHVSIAELLSGAAARPEDANR